MNKHYKILELNKILELLSNEASCADAKEAALGIEPSHGLFEVKELLLQTNDAHMLIGRFGAPSFGGVKNISNALSRAQAGGVLNAVELLRIAQTLKIIRTVKEWKKKSAGISTSLDLHFDSLSPNKFLEEKINLCIINEEELADNASPTLADIRKKIRIATAKTREVLEKIIRSTTYQKYLQDAIITQRGGRYVVPVKAECRGSVSGLVHDTSSSGATVFIEPMGVVQANNDIKVLQSKEDVEIERIFFELSALCGDFADEIINSYNFLIDIDLIFAKANLAFKMKAAMPELNSDGIISLNNARHPLINKDKVVPINIFLGNEFSTLVITGPNTGGKTVCLKTLGLLTLMAMCGLMIPAAENSKISVFNKILVDIGDEQSIEQSLSTFSAHMTNIVDILNKSDSKSLILIDELGAGTDPVEGAALAIAILNELKNSGAKLAATTHYAEIKAFALETDGVENGSCEFDVNTLKPTYRLLIGLPGRSNAFAISERLGISKSIIENANLLVSKENQKFENIVKTLEERHQQLEAKLENANETLKTAQEKEEKSNRILAEYEQKAELEIENAKKEAKRITETAKRQAYAILDALEKSEKGKKLSQQGRSDLKKDIAKMENDADPIKNASNENYVLPRELKAGDNVLLVDLNISGEVLEVSKDKTTVTVQAGIMKTRTNVKNLQLINSKSYVNKPKKPTFNSHRTVNSKTDKKVVTEIDLRGMAADEAILETERALDSALMMGITQLSIIHGKGTGVLRTQVQKFLKTSSAVKSFRLGTFGEGESGVTIVEVKS